MDQDDRYYVRKAAENDKDPLVRITAIRQLDSNRASNKFLLRKILENDPDASVRKAALEQLAASK